MGGYGVRCLIRRHDEHSRAVATALTATLGLAVASWVVDKFFRPTTGANLKQPKQLERIPPLGDKAEVPETLKGIGTPKTGNVREWDRPA